MAGSAIAAGTLALCLNSMGAGGAPIQSVAPLDATSPAFTLTWMHSIEKTQWQEYWQVVTRPKPHLRLVSARIETSGAGMEIPDNAVWRNGGYDYTVNQDLDSVTLSHSPFTQQAQLCVGQDCRLLSNWLPGLPNIQAVTLTPCHAP